MKIFLKMSLLLKKRHFFQKIALKNHLPFTRSKFIINALG